MAELYVPVGFPNRDSDQLDDIDLGYIIDDVAGKLVGAYGHNRTDDLLYAQIDFGGRQYRVDLPPQTLIRQEIRIPRGRQIDAVLDADGDWEIPFERLVVERVFTNPESASPTVLSITTTDFASATTSHDVAMPSTVDANDGLVTLFANYNNTITVTTPSGWSQRTTATGTNIRGGVYGKVAVGDEDGTTVDYVTSFATEATAHVYHIDAGTWAEDVTSIEVSTGATGLSTTPDPDSLTPSWGATGTTLYLAVCYVDDNNNFSQYPTNYTDGLRTRVNGTNDLALAAARRLLSGSPEDPGTFMMSASDNWLAVTVGVEDASGGTLQQGAAIPSQSAHLAADPTLSATATATPSASAHLAAASAVAYTAAATPAASAHLAADATVTAGGVLQQAEAVLGQAAHAAADPTVTVAAAAIPSQAAHAAAAGAATRGATAVPAQSAHLTVDPTVTVTAAAIPSASAHLAAAATVAGIQPAEAVLGQAAHLAAATVVSVTGAATPAAAAHIAAAATSGAVVAAQAVLGQAAHLAGAGAIAKPVAAVPAASAHLTADPDLAVAAAAVPAASSHLAAQTEAVRSVQATPSQAGHLAADATVTAGGALQQAEAVIGQAAHMAAAGGRAVDVQAAFGQAVHLAAVSGRSGGAQAVVGQSAHLVGVAARTLGVLASVSAAAHLAALGTSTITYREIEASADHTTGNEASTNHTAAKELVATAGTVKEVTFT